MTTSIYKWLAEPLPPDVSLMLTKLAQVSQIRHVAVMPDVHLAGEFCVGTVVGSDDTLFPGAVGGDIGCGMCAMAFDADASVLEDRQLAAELLATLYELIPAKRHHRALALPLPEELADQPISPTLEQLKRTGGDAHLQLGTLGGGNHFLELQADTATNRLWLMLHSGSRNAGQMIYLHHLPKAHRLAGGVMGLAADSEAGAAYLQDVAWARAYAEANRSALALAAARAIEQVLHVSRLLKTQVDSDHNHVALEAHAGRNMFVHRKGAQAAADGQAGLIPGSMATRSYHTLGRGCAESLSSCSHGAGRALSRHQARELIRPVLLKQQLNGIWYDHRIAKFLCEESPAAYRDIEEVMRAQHELVRIVRTLRPVLSFKSP